MNELLALIESPQNTPETRLIGARELLRQQWAETPPQITAILTSGAPGARVAVANAIADLPGLREDAYVEPLIAMLAETDALVRTAAAGALATYRDGGVIERLRALALAADRPAQQRAAAIEALGRMTDREAVKALVEIVLQENGDLRRAASAALTTTTGMTFGNLQELQRWWDESRALTAQEWQQQQIERLARQTRELSRENRSVIARLTAALRESYLRMAEADRAAVLQGYMNDGLAGVRLLGLDLVQGKLSEGQAPSSEVITLIRRLLTDGDSSVRAAAVRAIAGLRDATDAERFAAMLAAEASASVRVALINGLGYVGTVESTEPLLARLSGSSRTEQIEIVTALGRLIERGVLDDTARERTRTALTDMLRNTDAAAADLRERLISSLGILGDASLRETYAAALMGNEPVAIRQAAARALANLQDPAALDALATATTDPDLAVRKIAVEALARQAVAEKHLEMLAERLSISTEPDDAVRQAAWGGIVRVASTQRLAEIKRWLERLSPDDKLANTRAIALLSAADRTWTASPDRRDESAQLRIMLARRYAEARDTDAALETYLDALENMRAGEPQEIRAAVGEVLCFALRSGRYDERVRGTLVESTGPESADVFWSALRAYAEPLVADETAAEATRILQAFKHQPPTPLSVAVYEEIDALLERAARLAPLTSQPASNPAEHGSSSSELRAD